MYILKKNEQLRIFTSTVLLSFFRSGISDKGNVATVYTPQYEHNMEAQCLIIIQ